MEMPMLNSKSIEEIYKVIVKLSTVESDVQYLKEIIKKPFLCMISQHTPSFSCLNSSGAMEAFLA